ncbi:hypothetical protein N7528_009221 [Penicillium herquei]|nr:hypothetical protein N7528_009221 [Penicillium herquei]
MTFFHNALADNRTQEVHMNEVAFTSFSGTIRAIGTQNLNGCTGVGLFSPRGAIMAHIAPVPRAGMDTRSGLDNLNLMMSRFLSIYQENAHLFPKNSTTIIVGGAVDGTVALDHHIAQIVQRLAEQGLSKPALKLYQVAFAKQRGPAAGTFLIDSRSGAVAVYVEDKLLAI